MQRKPRRLSPRIGLVLGGLLFVATACAQQPVNQTALATMPAQAQAQVNSAPVPVLAPPEPALLTQAQVTIGNGYYSLSSRGDGITVIIQGSPLQSNTGTLVTSPVTAKPAGQRRVFTTVNEGIRSATWIEGRVAYSLDIECSNPSDARCASDEYLLGLVGRLIMVGGRLQ